MDMKEMMGAAQNVWETLDKLQQEDPTKYQAILTGWILVIGVLKIFNNLQEMVKESMQWQNNVKSQPEPCVCIEVKTKVIKDMKEVATKVQKNPDNILNFVFIAILFAS